MNFKVDPAFLSQEAEILQLLENFDQEGVPLGTGERNTIKLFELKGKMLNVKSFKVPNAVNKIVYRFFRKSKAERSFTYAQELLSKGVGTPQPVAYLEKTSPFSFSKSYYVSEHLEYDLTYRELVQQPNYPDHENILRAFTRFTYQLHENNIEFLDHSPGNTLIKKQGDHYNFFLVDLNRMNFKTLDFESSMKNFSRLTPKEEMVRIMANEYAKLIKLPEAVVFEKMWSDTMHFQEKFHRKQRLKRKLKFWKK